MIAKLNDMYINKAILIQRIRVFSESPGEESS